MRSAAVTWARPLARLLPVILTTFLVAGCNGGPRPTQVPRNSPSPTASGPATVEAGGTEEAVITLEPQTATPRPPTPTLTPLPPTPTPTPGPEALAERILLAPGATQTTVEGRLRANDVEVYALRLKAGQWIGANASVGTTGEGLRLALVGDDGAVVCPMRDSRVETVVPSTQDYYLELVSQVGTVDYRVSLLIPARIRFAPGATSAEVTGSLGANDARHYVLHARAGQRLIVDPSTSRGQVRMIIAGVDGQVLLSGRVGPLGGTYDGVLPETQEYLITVRAAGGEGADYTLEITIPPLSEARGGLTTGGGVA